MFQERELLIIQMLRADVHQFQQSIITIITGSNAVCKKLNHVITLPVIQLLISGGVTLTNTPSGTSTYGPSSNFNYTPITGSSRQMNELIPHTNAGSGADIGAFEVGEFGQQELIGLQNFIRQYGKKQQLQLIGILHQIGQQVMCQLLMCTL